jgi:hypothetical protein
MVKVSTSSNEVDLQWTAPAQGGVGIASYDVTRNGAALSTVTTPSATDLTVTPNTSYTYGIAAISFTWSAGDNDCERGHSSYSDLCAADRGSRDGGVLGRVRRKHRHVID